MDNVIIVAYENAASKTLELGRDRAFIRVGEQIERCKFKDATRFKSVRDASIYILGKIKNSGIALSHIRYGMLKADGTIDWLTRISHPVAFSFMDMTGTLLWTFKADDDHLSSRDNNISFCYDGVLPANQLTDSIKHHLERLHSISVTELSFTFNFKDKITEAKLVWDDKENKNEKER